MKTGFLQGLTHLILLLAVVMSFLPLIIYWCKRLAENKAYMVIAIFWMINGILYIPDIFNWNWYTPITMQIMLYYNLLDAPIICLIFYYAFHNKTFLYLIAGFFLFELLVIFFKGFNMNSNNTIIGTGCLLCLLLNIWGIGKYLKKVKHTETETVLVFVFAGFIFYYGLCVDILLISRYLKLTNSQGDYIMLLNYTAIFVATVLISFGLCKYAKPLFLSSTRY